MSLYFLVMKLHFVFGSLFVVGLVLFILWAAKNLNGEKLKRLSMWLVVIGIVGSIVSASCAKKYGMQRMQMHQQMAQEVLENHGVEFSEEEWTEIASEIKAAHKASWKGKWKK